MKTFTEESVVEIKQIIAKHRSISARENELLEKGYNVMECAMGSGGVGQVKKIKNEVRVQIESGHGRCNYAKCVTFSR